MGKLACQLSAQWSLFDPRSSPSPALIQNTYLEAPRTPSLRSLFSHVIIVIVCQRILKVFS